MKTRPVLRILGRLLLLLALSMLLPAIVASWYGEDRERSAFLIAAAATGALGGALVLLNRRADEDLYRREGVLIVVGGWVLASCFGALPFVLSGGIADPVDALFESASGFTTTGSTILADVESLGRSTLFWRSFTQWLGGMGIIVLFVALLPELGAGARFLYKLEVPGPTAKTLHPRVRDTATVLWRLYLVLTVAETLLLMAAGLDVYDALTATFSTLSTGGFSPYNASISHFRSPWVEVVIIVFMIVAGANFSLFVGVQTLGPRRGLRDLLRDPEIRVYLGLIAVVTLLITAALLQSDLYDHSGRGLLDSLFQTISILTTTGFGTADFDTWPSFARLILVILMFVGGCAGSTAGAMKVMRVVIGWKAAFREVQLIFKPNAVLAVFVGRQAVPNPVVSSVVAFLLLYMSSWAAGSLLLSVGGVELATAASASAAVLGNIGPGVEAVGPTANFGFFAPWQKLLMVVLMWLGRLEVLPIAALATASFWRR